MGVSVSASTAIIVAGMFFAFTAFYPVAANGFDRVTEGERDVHDRALERQNTAFAVDSATFNASGNDELVVNATNGGSVGLVVTDATLVVDNEYVDVADATTTVDGDGDTDLWLGGERLVIEVDGGSLETTVTNDSRVVLVVESGVRAATGVSALMARVPVSHLILFVASLVIAAGVVGTVTTGVDRVSAAVEDGSLDATQQLRTDVTVISDPNGGVYDADAGENGTVTLLVKNTGTQRLAPDGSGLDVVFDGTYVLPSATTGELVSVDGAAAWSRGDVLRLTIDLDSVDGVDPSATTGTTDHRVYLTVNGDEELFQFRVGA